MTHLNCLERDKLYEELGFESLHDRRWFRKLCFHYKIRHNSCPLYLTELLPIMKTSYDLNHLNRSPIVFWNQLDPNILNLFFKFLNEHYLVLFVLSQLMYTGFTIHED